MTEIPKPQEIKDFNEFIKGLKPRLDFELPTPESAIRICDTLNEMFSSDLGKVAVIDCGAVYYMGDGQQVGGQHRTGRDMGDKFDSGIKGRGILKRFDVLETHDLLVTRGTKVPVFEPSLVYEEIPHIIHRAPEPKVSEVYVPLIRLNRFEIIAES
jgi:hypothetical protein